jgi:O-6-methylguanine DNA methyltransferase
MPPAQRLLSIPKQIALRCPGRTLRHGRSQKTSRASSRSWRATMPTSFTVLRYRFTGSAEVAPGWSSGQVRVLEFAMRLASSRFGTRPYPKHYDRIPRGSPSALAPEKSRRRRGACATIDRFGQARRLLAIPCSESRTYADIAPAVGRPQGFRAVAMAIDRNPAALVVPCHRCAARVADSTGSVRCSNWKTR